MQQAQTFLAQGEQVQVQVFLKGRQRAHPDRAIALLEELGSTWLDPFGRRAHSPSPQRIAITYNPKKK